MNPLQIWLQTELFEEKQQLFDAMFRSWKKKMPRGTKAQLYIKSMEEVAEKLNVTWICAQKKSLCTGQLTQWIRRKRSLLNHKIPPNLSNANKFRKELIENQGTAFRAFKGNK
jgi:hypothetical protein